MERKTISYSCIVPACESAYRGKIGRTRRFFKVPRIEPYRSKWLDNLGITQAYKSARVCDLHFDTKYFTSTLRHRLIKFAIPTLLDPSEYSTTAAQQSSTEESDSSEVVITLISNNDLATQLEGSQSSFNNSNNLSDHELNDNNQHEEDIDEHESVYIEIEDDNEVVDNLDDNDALVVENSEKKQNIQSMYVEDVDMMDENEQEVDGCDDLKLKGSKIVQYKIVLPMLEDADEKTTNHGEQNGATLSDEFDEAQNSETGIIVFDPKVKKKMTKRMKILNPRNDIIKIQQQTIKNMRKEITFLKNKVNKMHHNLKTLNEYINNSKTS